MDANTREAAGSRALAATPGADPLVFAARSGLKAGPAEVALVHACAGDSPRIVAVGSGVITDIVRFAAHQLDRDFISVPTAASMDGYASSVAALEIEGVKVTEPARAPIAILADPRVIAAAPLALTRSGIGDLLGKATARVDWLAAHLLYGESFCDEAAERVLAPLRFASNHTSAVLAGDSEAVTELLRGLIESGIAMAIAGNSRPASGCEHHASHFWDLLAARGLQAHAPHGLQVGHATRYAMRLQRFAFGGSISELRPPAAVCDPLGPDAREWLGEPTPDIVAAVHGKRAFIRDHADRWPADRTAWRAVRERLASSLALFEAVNRALDQAQISCDVDAGALRATFRHATRLRSRYTTIDFLEGQGMLDAAIEAMIS